MSEDRWADGPVWSKAETHCVACLRPFAAAAEEERHAEKDCDSDPCWCESFCWVNQGGDCLAVLEGPDELSLLVHLRGVIEAREAERDALASALRETTDALHEIHQANRYDNRCDDDGDCVVSAVVDRARAALSEVAP